MRSTGEIAVDCTLILILSYMVNLQDVSQLSDSSNLAEHTERIERNRKVLYILKNSQYVWIC